MGSLNSRPDHSAFIKNLQSQGHLTSANTCSDPENPWYEQVPVDDHGCRQLPPLPPPGVHPRLLFTASEIPFLIARLTHTCTGREILKDAEGCSRDFRKMFVGKFGTGERKKWWDVDVEDCERMWKVDEMRNVVWFMTLVHAVVVDDHELIDMVKFELLHYAKMILVARDVGLSGIKDGYFKVWSSNNFDVGTGRLFGGLAFALGYDVFFNDFTDLERNTYREAIACAVEGRRSWGMGWPGKRIQSNWAAYHGELLALCAVIEGEEGFDQEVYDLFKELMTNYCEYAVYDSGHPIEDTYAINLGFREGSIALLVLARRGTNLFRHPHYENIWKEWLPHALHPDCSGLVYGGSSGNAWIYPGSIFVAKYMYPRDKVVDWAYRHYMCENGSNYARVHKWQNKVLAALCALPAHDDAHEDLEWPSKLGLPLTFFCQDRGKVATRNEWTDQAFWFTFDARADGFLIGHDTCSRGSFVLNCHGRSWVVVGEWRVFRESQDYSLVHIDGIGQILKAPMVKFLSCEDSPNSLYASADLTYAYNWKWTEWAKKNQKMGEGWEVEPNDPRDFGIPQNSWVPNKLFDQPDVAFAGLYQWRQRFNHVEKVLRSTLVVRAPVPFLIVADDVKKDNAVHNYQWHLSTASDLLMESFNGVDIILRETSDEKRGLLVRILSTGEQASVTATFQEKHEKLEKGRAEYIGRLILSATLIEAHFKILLYPLEGPRTPVPQTTWTNKSTLALDIPQSGVSQDVVFHTGISGETIMNVSTNDHVDYQDTCSAVQQLSNHSHGHGISHLRHHGADKIKELLNAVSEKAPKLSSAVHQLIKK